jgi:hypothetical protein
MRYLWRAGDHFLRRRAEGAGRQGFAGARWSLEQQQGENSHLPFRRKERAMGRFRRMKTLQNFVAVHSSVHNHFAQERHLVSREVYKERRSVALAEWQTAMA